MIIQKSFINKLKDFGLNSYESKLWTALLSRGISTAGELSDIANVPRSRSYDVLENLEKKGFIIMKVGKPIKYIAVPPTEVIDRVKKKIQRDADEQTEQMSKIEKSELLQELSLLHTQSINFVEPGDLTGAFKGRNNIHTHLSSLIKEAKKSIMIFTTADGLERKGSYLYSVLSKAQSKGVKIKIAAPITKESHKYAKKLSKIADVRHTNINSRFVLVDDKDMTFMLMDDKETHSSYDIGIWAKTPYFASTMSGFFNATWSDMTPLSKVKF